VLSLRWSALDDNDRTMVAVRSLNRARNLAEAESALADFQVVTQSFVLADVEGHIGFVVAGRIPVRRPDNDLRGIAPSPGWDARYEWQGYLDSGANPRTIDPPSGILVTANNRIVGNDFPHHLTFEWFTGYRAQRIRRLIESREKHDVASSRAIQSDVVSIPA